MPDIRVAQLVVSIFQVELNFHFASLEKLRLANVYYEGEPTAKFEKFKRQYLDLDGLLELFDYFYRTNIELFRQILEFLLNDWFMHHGRQ